MKAEIAVGLFVTLLVSSGLIYSMGQDDSTQVEQTSQVQSSAPFLRDNAPKEHLSKKSLDSSIPLTSSQFEDFVIPLGYPVEIHWVTTSDGYILKLYRIPGKKNESPSSYNNRPRVPMFLQHGLLDSSDTFILNQEDKAIAFTLANSGFDVWLGNTRGNKYSLQNIHFNYKTEAFWDFTWNDMADKDLPTMLTYVTEETGYSQVVYVGHSQGTVITWAGASDPVSMDIVNEKIALFIALGPATYVHYSTSLLVQAAADARLAKLLADFKFSRFLLPTPWGDLPDIVISEACKISELLCEGGMRLISDEEPSLVDNARDYIFFDHFPSGTGVKNMEMWAQQIRKQSLQKFDYGSNSANMNAYGVPSPPVYDLANMKIPTVMFVGKEDKLADLKDAEDFRAKLNEAGNSLIGFHIADCGHLGFLLDTDVDYWYVALSYIKEYATRIADNHAKKH